MTHRPTVVRMLLLLAVCSFWASILNGCGGSAERIVGPAAVLSAGWSQNAAETLPGEAPAQTDTTAGIAGTGTLGAAPSASGPLVLVVPRTIFTEVGAFTAFQARASGGTASYTITASGLPEAFSLSSGTGWVSGIASVPGVATADFLVTDAVGGTASGLCTITVIPGLQLEILPFLHVQPNQAIQSLVVYPTNGVPPYSFRATGFPTGLGLGTARGFFGLITGSTKTLGSFRIELEVRDAAGKVASGAMDLTVSAAGFWLEVGMSAIRVGDRYDQQICKGRGGQPYLTSSGARVYDYSVTGLPPGISLVSSQASRDSGGSQAGSLVSGTANTAGIYPISVGATDSEGRPASGMGYILVDRALP